jgi:hypothetical protein
MTASERSAVSCRADGLSALCRRATESCSDARLSDAVVAACGSKNQKRRS